MPKKIIELRYIFGLKLKELRQERRITYQELSKKSGLSVSYLSEIESGKKYPKGDKIFLLANALDTSYDELVSIKVPAKLQPIIEVIESDFMKHFPLEEFGLNPQKVIEVVAQDPNKINAFIKTILQVARNHELTTPKFYYAALKTFQELSNNYFEELEETVEVIHLEFTELAEIPFSPKVVEEVLLSVGVRTDWETLSTKPSLKNLRSLYHSDQRLLMINKGLTKGQMNFLLGREIAFQWLKLKIRPLSTPPLGDYNFEELLNSYKASYFSAALLMPKREVIPDIRSFAKLPKWESDTFLKMVSRYEATPEMLMQRLTNIIPSYFKVRNMFFLRILKSGGEFYLTKEIHISGGHNTHGNELNEHYCRRWLGVRVIDELEAKGRKQSEIISRAQISNYHGIDSEYFCMSLAFPNISNPEESISVTVGLLNDRSLKRKANFIETDKSIPHYNVNITCERCPITDCKERMAAPVMYERLEEENQAQQSVEELLNS